MKMINKLKNSEFWTGVVKLSAGQLIGQVITLGATLILSRIYTDADYGNFGIITSTAAIIMSIIGLALGSAVMVADTDEDSKRIFTVAYFLQIILLAVVLLGMVALMPIKRFFDTPIPYVAALMLMGIHIALNILCSMTKIYVNRQKMNNVLFWNSLINAGCTVCISIPMGFLGFGFLGLLLASILAELLCTMQMFRKAFPFKRIQSYAEIKQTFLDCKRFVLFQYPSNMMGTVSNNMPNQTLYNLFGDTALGAYAMCNKVFNLPLNLIIAPIQTIYFRTAAQMKDQKEQLAEFTYGFFKKMMLVAAIPMVVCMAFGEYIFGFVLGWQWAEAGLIAAIMCPYFFFWFCNSTITYLRVAIGHQRENLYMTFVQLLSALLALGLSKVLNQDLIATIGIFSAINMIYNLVDIVVSFVCLKKYYWRYLLVSAAFIAACVVAAGGLRFVL